MPLPLLNLPRFFLSRTGLPGVLARHDGRLVDAELSAGLAVLDLGCGESVLAERILAAIGPQGSLVCVDAHSRLLDKAKARLQGEPRVELLRADSSETGLAAASFDRIILHNVFHQLKDRGGTIREARRLLKPGGKLWVWEPRSIVQGWQIRAYEGMFLGSRFELDHRGQGLVGMSRRFVAVDSPAGSRLR